MKFVVLAATVGYVFGAIDADCGTLAGGDTPCESGEYCNLAVDSTEGNSADNGKCAAQIEDGLTCTVGGDCTSGVCEGPCGASLTCGANDPVDGAVGGCCSDSVAVTDTAANYCADGTVTEKKDDGEECSVQGNGAECKSGTCAATADDTDPEDTGACAATQTDTTTTTVAPQTDGTTTTVAPQTDATTTTVAPAEAGATGGACRTGDALVTGIDAIACGDNLTCTTADATDGATGFCQDADSAPTEADDTQADGTLGGACNAAVTAVAACDGTDVCTDSVCTAAPDTTAATDDSPAAVFYGASMVAGAIAYLL